MEKAQQETGGSKRQYTRPASWPAYLLVPLISFLALYNLVPDFHDAVQDFFAIPEWNDPTPSITLKQGSYLGRILLESNHPVPIEAFLGIPYAMPPVGERRFRKANPVPMSSGLFNATEYSHMWRNGFSHQKKMPVLVYIHGGAFNLGFGAMHDTASMLAWSAEPFLAVSFNYRLGALGFLNSDMPAEKENLNLGLHDQKLLLEWVQENIETFGGDPNDVTIAGLSAGAHSVGHHLMDVNEKRTLFHKAIIESGGATSRATHPANSKLHKAQFNRFVSEVGCSGKKEFDTMVCLRQASTEAAQKAQTKVFDEYNPSVRWAWQPVIDNNIIPRRPVEAWSSGNWHKVPILTGFNHNEGTMYVPKNMRKSDEFTKFFNTLLPQLSQPDLEALEKLYLDPAKVKTSPYVDTRDISSLGIGEQFKRVEAAYGQYAYVCPVRQTAELGSHGQNAPIFLYHWAVNRTVLGGANHGDQIAYEAMSPLVRAISPTHDTIAQYFNAFLTSFILTGNPNKLVGTIAPQRPAWPPYVQGGKTMIFGAGNDEAVGGSKKGVEARLIVDEWAEDACEFWWAKTEEPED